MAADYSYAEMLRLTDRIRRPAIEGVLRALELPPGSHGIDAGCGIGLYTPMLARLVGPKGYVTGVDTSESFLEEARRETELLRSARQVDCMIADVTRLPFRDDSIDWLVSIDTIWPGPAGRGVIGEDTSAIVAELARVVRPGGLVALVFWSSHRLLPGHPQLEARLQATAGATAPFDDTMAPDLHFMAAISWLTRGGLTDCTARSAVTDIAAPLTAELREALAVTYHMLWSRSQSELADDDWTAYKRLCDPDSAEFIADLSGYHGLVTYTAYSGTVG